jgi:hypothetical protein
MIRETNSVSFLNIAWYVHYTHYGSLAMKSKCGWINTDVQTEMISQIDVWREKEG